MGLVKTRRLAAMQKHPPSPRLRRTGQRAKAGVKKPPRPSEDRVRGAKPKHGKISAGLLREEDQFGNI